jgi:hypothetical protein
MVNPAIITSRIPLFRTKSAYSCDINHCHRNDAHVFQKKHNGVGRGLVFVMPETSNLHDRLNGPLVYKGVYQHIHQTVHENDECNNLDDKYMRPIAFEMGDASRVKTGPELLVEQLPDGRILQTSEDKNEQGNARQLNDGLHPEGRLELVPHLDHAKRRTSK